MREITAIKAQVRRSDRVSVYLDEEFWTGMSQIAVLDLGLAVGDTLDEADKTRLESEIGRAEALYFCIERLAEQARTRHQLAEKLRAREYGPEVIDACLAQCEELLLLDDEQYARDVASARRDAGHGPAKVRVYLQRKAGVSKELIDMVLAETYDPDSDFEVVQRVLAERFRSPELTRDEQRRALAFLLRRGFDSSLARRAVDERAMSREDEQAAEDPEEAAGLLRSKYGSADRSPRGAVQGVGVPRAPRLVLSDDPRPRSRSPPADRARAAARERDPGNAKGPRWRAFQANRRESGGVGQAATLTGRISARSCRGAPSSRCVGVQCAEPTLRDGARSRGSRSQPAMLVS